MPFNQLGFNATLMDFARERANDASAVSILENGKLQGRFRNSGSSARAAPSSPTNVISGDAEGDEVNDGTYIYRLTNVFGVGLRWERRTINVAW